MPRVNLGKPKRQTEIEDGLRKQYGGSLTIGNLCELLNTTERRTAAKFVEGVPAFMVGTRKRWRVEDVAKFIHERTV